MSLGWSTESALLPSKARPIHIDSSSMLALKAVVGDHLARKNGGKCNSAAEHGKRLTPRGSNNSNSKSGGRVDEVLRNPGVDQRNQADAVQMDRKHEHRRRRLEQKARTYDELQRQCSGVRQTYQDNEDNYEYDEEEEVEEGFLVNFKAKPVVCSPKSDSNAADSSSTGRERSGDGDEDRYCSLKRRRPTEAEDSVCPWNNGRATVMNKDKDREWGADGTESAAAVVSTTVPCGAGTEGAAAVQSQWTRVLNSNCSARAFKQQAQEELRAAASVAVAQDRSQAQSQDQNWGSSSQSGERDAKQARLALILARKAKNASEISSSLK